MEKLLTTKDLALAIGASESSLRRWTNSGVIATSRTVGGHRRIPLSEAVRFIRTSHATVVRPDLLGLPPSPAEPRTDDDFHDALAAGDADRARAALATRYLAGASLAELADQQIHPAMRRIGTLWEHDSRGILVEHRALDVCVTAVATLRTLLPPVPPTAPLALGGAPAGDVYLLPSLVAAAVLAECGYRDVNLGPNTPVELIAPEALARGATLVWLSVSHAPDDRALTRSVTALARALGEKPLVLGGRAAAALLPLASEPNIRVLNSMTDLATFARGLR